MKNDARKITALSRVSLENQYGKSPNKGRCYEESKLALASVGAKGKMKNEERGMF
jgi:hypothetical protein